MTLLGDAHVAIRDLVRELVRKEVSPFALEWDRTGHIPGETLRRIGELGLFGICVPREWGGAGADLLSYVVAIEELAYGDAGLCNLITATNNYGLRLDEFGTPDQKEEFLRPVASGGAYACMLLTEPQAGSDASNLRTRAERQGDHYVLNGTKVFITSGRTAGAAIALAVSDPGAGKHRISAFLVRPDQPGYVVVRDEHKLGHRSNETCQILLENLQVPARNLLGQPGEGLRVALSGLESGRIGVAAQSVGVARAALDAALKYAREREAFGKKLVEHQAIAFQLAEMATEIEVARSMAYHATELKLAGRRSVKEASIAKLFASQMSERVCSKAIQIHGGYGYLNDYRVEKYYRDARVFQIYDGTNEVQKIVIARELAREAHS
ncbi:MAG: acyl-CoA dehydrogenase family protein [Chloroflexi bacterium]|nr:acyl-CoA dehydrogenase family protein [Chloroflexota bacterium]